MRRIRVLALMESASVGGPAKNLFEFARRARAGGADLPPVDLHLATYLRGPAGEPNDFIRAAREAGIPVEVIAEEGRFDFGVLPRLRAVVTRLSPDLIQTHNVKSHLLVRLARFSIPWIAFHHGYTARDLRDRLYNHFDRFSLRGARHVVTVCRPFAEMIRGLGVPAERISVLHNSVPPFTAPPAGVVAAVRARFGLAEGVPVVLAVGRLSSEKGHADLVKAAARLRRVRPELAFRLVLVGDGPERSALEKLVAALALSDLVVLCGHQRDVRPFYALAAALALPSRSEGSPNVLLEAMAAGVPVVAARVGGVPEIAPDGETALLVPPGDAAALAGALTRVLGEPARAAERAGRAQRRVLADFTPERNREQLVRLYQPVLAGR
jgi:glycosyltransferase involved in cell wall biosynthesis